MTACIPAYEVRGSTAYLTGELDIATVTAVRHALHSAVQAADGRPVVADLGGVTFLDPITLGALLDARDEAMQRGLGFEVRGIGRKAERLVRLAGVGSLLGVDGSEGGGG